MTKFGVGARMLVLAYCAGAPECAPVRENLAGCVRAVDSIRGMSWRISACLGQ